MPRRQAPTLGEIIRQRTLRISADALYERAGIMVPAR
jgi:hypothetical protein